MFATVALADSLYLSIEHFYPGVLACPNTGIIDCTTVLTSGYSSIFGVPIALLGFVWSVVLIFIFFRRDAASSFLAPIWYMLGILAVAYSFSAQYLIGKICIYCTTLDTSIIILVLVCIFYLKLHDRK
ncbi:MAG: vitamin K epoxide reductase family protein [Methanothrix sp.]